MPDVVAQSPIVELKASAHLMTLGAGVFCVFNTPGSAAPDMLSGLPGVRISPAPAPGGHEGAVTISGFSGDGWLGGAEDAALIRVAGGPAQVLVTVYQAKDTEHAAPKLQVIRLTEDAPSAADTQAVAAAPEPSAPIEVAAHIYGLGDVGGRIGEWMGERGSKRWIEGFGLAPTTGVALNDIEYQAVLGRGWLSPWSEGGQFCGSRGMSLPILGLRVRLRGAAAETHVATVQATFIDGAEIGPVINGEACEAPSLAALEAFCVTFEPLAQPAEAPATAAAPKAKRAKKPAAPAPEPTSTAKRTSATARRR